MTKILCLLSFLFSLLNAQAQLPGGSPQPPPPAELTAHRSAHPTPVPTHGVLIKRIVLKEEQNDLAFPLILMADTAVASEINRYLQGGLLDQDHVRICGEKLFAHVKWTPGGGGMDELDYIVLVNSDNLLSLEFDGEVIGAHPSPFQQYFQFDLRSGEPLLLNQIATQDGIKELEKDLLLKRQVLIVAHLVELKNDTDALANLDDIRDNMNENNKDADKDNFSILPTGLRFHHNGNLPHVMEAWDVDLAVDYSFQQFLPWIDDFGKKLLLKP